VSYKFRPAIAIVLIPDAQHCAVHDNFSQVSENAKPTSTMLDASPGMAIGRQRVIKECTLVPARKSCLEGRRNEVEGRMRPVKAFVSRAVYI
jgi:hypothetical protein